MAPCQTGTAGAKFPAFGGKNVSGAGTPRIRVRAAETNGPGQLFVRVSLIDDQTQPVHAHRDTPTPLPGLYTYNLSLAAHSQRGLPAGNIQADKKCELLTEHRLQISNKKHAVGTHVARRAFRAFDFHRRFHVVTMGPSPVNG